MLERFLLELICIAAEQDRDVIRRKWNDLYLFEIRIHLGAYHLCNSYQFITA